MILNFFLSSIPRRFPFRSVFVSWLNWQSGRSKVHPRSAICCSVGRNGISGLGFSSFGLFRRRFRSRWLPPGPPRFRRPAFKNWDNDQIKTSLETIMISQIFPSVKLKSKNKYFNFILNFWPRHWEIFSFEKSEEEVFQRKCVFEV